MDENIDKIENSSFIYDIINSQSNFTLFFFSVLFVITILVFSSIEITFTLFVGLIIYVLFIKYYSTMNDTQNINEQEKFEIKKNKYNISNNHPKIIDFLFNIEDLKQFSFILFNELKILIINFVNTYDDCINDYTLVNDYYNTLINLKLKILITIENFNINGAPKDIVINNKQMIENILNKYLDNLKLLNDKNNYYNGFDLYAKEIEDNNNIKPSNLFDYENVYRGNLLDFNIQNYNFI
jgi:hypothetical protein